MCCPDASQSHCLVTQTLRTVLFCFVLPALVTSHSTQARDTPGCPSPAPHSPVFPAAGLGELAVPSDNGVLRHAQCMTRNREFRCLQDKGHHLTGGQVLRLGKLRVLRRPPAGLRHMGQGHGEPTGPPGSTPPQGLQGAHDQASPQALYSGQVLFPPSLTLPCPRAKAPGTSFSLAPDTRLVHPHDISFKQPESTAPTHAYCPPSLWRCLNGRRSSRPLASLGQMGGERNAGQDEHSPVTKEQHTRPLPTAAERSRRR